MRLPTRLTLAELVCGMAPPLVSPRLRAWIYPRSIAYRDKLEYSRRSLTGSQFTAPTGDFHGYPFAVQGYYDWRNWALARALCNEGDAILEVGANIGTETVGFRDLVGWKGRVIAIEPVSENVARLDALVKLNGWTNVTVLKLALSDQNGIAGFCPSQDPTMSGVGFLDPGAMGARTMSVMCATLDGLETQIGAVRVIFMDCEGAEPRILRGGMHYIDSHRPAIVLEASPKHLRRARSSLIELFDAVKRAGYIVFAIERLGMKRIDRPNAQKAGNWLCLHRDELNGVRTCARQLLLGALLPPWRGLHPLARCHRATAEAGSAARQRTHGNNASF